MLMASFIIFIVVVFVGLIFMLRKIMTQNIISATQHIDELNQDYTKKDEVGPGAVIGDPLLKMNVDMKNDVEKILKKFSHGTRKLFEYHPEEIEKQT